MDVSNLAPYAKTIVAILGALVATVSCFLDGAIGNEDIVTIIAAWATVFGVYQTRNANMREIK